MAKKWYQINAPKVFNSVDIGQTLAEDPKELTDRRISVPLSRLIDNRSKQHIIVKLEVDNIKDNIVEMKVVSYKLSRTHLVRFVRRGISRVDSIDNVVTKDGKKIIVKSMLITAFKAKRRQTYSLRKELSEYVKNNITEYSLDDFLVAVSIGKFQMQIKKKLSKVYPLRYVEIRAIEIQ